MRKIAIVAALTATMSFSGARSYAQFPATPGTGPGLAETIEAIDSARVTTRILYVTAHPDDESAAVLTYLARGLHADVALLSLTHGEGGQNALGPEQAPQLGLIRTQELLAATRGYGVKLYFTRAKDFGFSKTPEETEKVWGEEVLLDMAHVIRDFRPNIIINGWGGVHQGHGHHQAAGLLTPKAVAMAEDPNHTECIRCGDLYAIPVHDVVILDLDRFSERPTGYVLPVDEVSPLYGKTWREIGLDAFVNHRTQGVSNFVSSPFLRRPVALKREDGQKLDPKILSESLKSLGAMAARSHCADGKELESKLEQVDKALAKARTEALALDWQKATKSIVNAAADFPAPKSFSNLHGCKDSGLVQMEAFEVSKARIMRAVQLVAGIELTANANRSDILVGGDLSVNETARCREGVDCVFGEPTIDLPDGFKINDEKKGSNGNNVLSLSLEKTPEPRWWLELDASKEPSLLDLKARAALGDYSFFVTQAITHVDASSTRVDRVPLRIVPAYTLAVEPKQTLELVGGERKEFDVFLRVHSYSAKNAKVAVGLDVPKDWVYNGPVDVSFTGEGDRYTKFTVTPPAGLAAGNYPLKAFAMAEGASFTTSIEPLPSMPTLVWEEPAQTVVHAFNIKVPENLRVGYISAESEPVPDALKMLGIHVEMLDANAVNFGDLSKYDAIVVGVRAYELRSELPGANQRLLDYAKNGGTLVVQYQRDFAWDGKNYAPYPAKIANKQGDPLPRITDENSPVKFLKPDDSLLNTPNKITQDDFKGWVQERGLYFWSEYDSHYAPLLAMNDPGEKDLDGALLYTKLDKGTYVYTGIAFFRQLPEGVPGAYRLFVNLLSASRSH
jgi:LmbE family N-acetylglucosaminyl deacetylase